MTVVTDTVDTRWRPSPIRWRNVNTEIDPTRSYTPRELDVIAEALLMADKSAEQCVCGGWELDARHDVPMCADCGSTWQRGTRPSRGHDDILTRDQMIHRRRMEIVSDHVVDPSVEAGLFKRSHSSLREGEGRVTYKQRKRDFS